MKYSNKVIVWLFIGLVMVFIQVVVGGITRLTESGLSITKWEVVSGTLPPLTELGWENEFNLYKETPQYKEINEGMSLEDFKFIYFWEYIHRFWARIMGFVFIIPFLWFFARGYLDKAILSKLGWVVLLALLAATFGWIMVASGLIERPWVNAYKLSLHLCIAFAVYAMLLWTYLFAKEENITLPNIDLTGFRRLVYVFLAVLVFQIFMGGVISGMKAAVVFPTWPDMNGVYLPEIIFDIKQWNADNFNNYDKNLFMPALVHFVHRGTAYILFLIGLFLVYRIFSIINSQVDKQLYVKFKLLGVIILLVLSMQVILGIITVISSKGEIPVSWGVLHQAGGLLLLTTVVYTIFVLKIKK
ncbi:MAG TPA: COX15/CtaA family protein [Saprospiraceae bacterium]|nr:COX15/CtaA family protein [Saprospiraceae bacterium]